MIEHEFKFIDDKAQFFFIHIPKTGGSYMTKAMCLNHSKDLKKENFYQYTNNKIFCRRSTHSSANRMCFIDHGYSYDYNFMKDKLVFSVIRNPFDMLLSQYKYATKGVELTESFESYVKKFCNLQARENQKKIVEKLFKRKCLEVNKDNLGHNIGIRSGPAIRWPENTKSILGPELRMNLNDFKMPYNLRQNLFHQLFDDEGICIADFVLRIEDIKVGLTKLNNRLNSLHGEDILTIPENRVNRSNFFGDNRRLCANYSTGILSKMLPKEVLKLKNGAKHSDLSTIKKTITSRLDNYKLWYSDKLVDIVNNYFKKELDFFGYTFDGYDKTQGIIFPKGARFNKE